MSTGAGTLTPLRELLEKSQATLNQCMSSYKRLLAFRDNAGAIVFCRVQLEQAARALREHADGLMTLAGDIQTTPDEATKQLELVAVPRKGRP